MMIIIFIWFEKIYAYCGCESAHKMVFYVQLDKRFASVAAEKVSKKKRIEATVLNSFTPLSKSDICSILPDVSPTTVEAVLGAMVRGGLIRRLGGGRGTKYIKA